MAIVFPLLYKLLAKKTCDRAFCSNRENKIREPYQLQAHSHQDKETGNIIHAGYRTDSKSVIIFYPLLNQESHNMDITIILTGLAVFMARIVDVSVGTIRIISIVNGRIKTAFVLGFIEVSIWLLVISTVLGKINESPIIAIFYALGYASGNVVGIVIEKRISLGNSLLRIISLEKGLELATEFRRLGFQVMTFDGI